MENNLALDIQELQLLRQSAKRPDNIKLLDARITLLKSQLELKQKSQTHIKVQPPKTQSTKTRTNAITVTKYSYDQDSNKVKIYLSFDSIGTQITQDQIQPKFQANSLEILIKGYKGNDYLFAIKKLFGPIKPQQSKCILKTNNIIISLVKTDGKHWDGIYWKEDKFSADTKSDLDKGDPEAGLMNLMKKMYQEGDDNMKKTIAESWTKSRQTKK